MVMFFQYVNTMTVQKLIFENPRSFTSFLPQSATVFLHTVVLKMFCSSYHKNLFTSILKKRLKTSFFLSVSN